jgi:hypothetical protein
MMVTAMKQCHMQLWLPMPRHVLRFKNGHYTALEVLLNCGNVSGTSCTGSRRMDVPLWPRLFHALVLLLLPLAMFLITHWFQDLKGGRHDKLLVSDLLPMATTERRWISVEQGQLLCHKTVYIKVEWDGYVYLSSKYIYSIKDVLTTGHNSGHQGPE